MISPTRSSDPADIDRDAPRARPAGTAVMRQRWQELLFLHWEIPREAIEPKLPQGVELDTFEGRAFVGLVPFTMKDVRPVGLPSVPWLSNFHETNVRTYVNVPGVGPGVWFFSLDAANPVAAALGRLWFRLPYFYARMSLSVSESSDTRLLTYASSRITPGPKPATTRLSAEVSAPVEPARPGSLVFFLAERYLLFTGTSENLMSGRVHHTPYPLQTAEVTGLDESLLAAAGFRRPSATPLAHFASGVDVEVFPLEPVRRT